jgi:hypothetical protein
MTASPTWQPIMGDGTAIEGYWEVSAASEAAAKLIVEQRMHARAYYSLCMEWVAQGKRVRVVVVNDSIRA